MSSKISTWRLIGRFTVWLMIICALLFGGAGTLAWTEAQLYILIQAFCWGLIVLWLGKNNPELLKERTEFRKRLEKPRDKAYIILATIAFMPLYILPGVDAVRYQWSHVPPTVKIVGFAGIVLSTGIIFWVLKTNPFATAVVAVQEDRGHKVITSGPYQYVRHPMYVGAGLSFSSIPLALGSWITFAPVVLLTALVAARTYPEDETLHQDLDGDTAYAQKVKYRLIPGVR